MRLTSRSRQGLALVAGLALALPLLVGQGCPTTSLSTGSAPVVAVNSPALDQTLAVGERVTIVYDVTTTGTTSVSAFYDRDGTADTGDEVTFLTGLPTGQDKFTQLLTSSLSAGSYHIGIKATNSSGSATAYSPARINLNEAPQVTFNAPSGPVRVGNNVTIPIEFNGGISTYNWRTFYDTDGIFDGDESTIQTGFTSGNSVVTTSLETSTVVAGTYYLGATVTTPTGGTATHYAPGTITVVSGSFVQVLAPTVGLIAPVGTIIQIVVAANDPANSAATVRIFYDTDNNFSNGVAGTIATIPANGSGTSWDTKDVVVGNYYIGAELLNGLTTSLVSYSAGPVQIGVASSGQTGGSGGTGGGGGGGGGTVGTLALTVTTPASAQSLLQNRIFRISWTTNLGAGQGTVTVFREPDFNNDGTPDGPATRITIGNPGIDAAQQFVDLDTTGLIGKFFVGATLTPVSGISLTDYAEGTVTIKPLVFWVGDLLTRKDATGRVIPQSGPFQGAVFQGHNFFDNLGSTMTVADDYDNDARNEIILGAQYGKPFFFAQGGRGAGEAYMIYGPALRLSGTFDINATGSTSLPGVIFSGIVPNPSPGTVNSPAAQAGTSVPYGVDGQPAEANATEGLRSVITIPDQDNDGKREIAFAFPYCNSYSIAYQLIDRISQDRIDPDYGRLENNGQFLRGGVVVVSSRNSVINSRVGLSRRFDRVIELHEVGQTFTAMGAPSYWPGREEHCPNYAADAAGNDTWVFPCEGFWQSTDALGPGTDTISPPRLADPLPTGAWLIHPAAGAPFCLNPVQLSQVDAPRGPTDPAYATGLTTSTTFPNPCPIEPGSFGTMYLAGTGFYSENNSCDTRLMETPLEPYGYRLLGQETTQPSLGTTANRFGHSISTSGNYLLVGAPRRSALRSYVPSLPVTSRAECGEVYMVPLQKPGSLRNEFPYALPDGTYTAFTAPARGPFEAAPSRYNPYPHNWIINDVGFHTYNASCRPYPLEEATAYDNIGSPFHVVGAAQGDQIGEVVGIHDLSGDGVEDFLVGGAGTNAGRGAVYVIYRRQSQIEGDYLLDRLQLDPGNIERLNGLMIIGEPGENLGTSIGGGGRLNDDFNDDGNADALIGDPRAVTAAGFNAGQVFVLFGGHNLMSPAGGITLTQLRNNGDGVLLTGAHSGDMTGTTVASAGDVNGDGIPDIMISAPEASPRFDSDGDGIPDTIGLDLDGNLVPDDLDGDGVPDDLTHAGLVYVVFGGSHLTGTLSLSHIGTKELPGITIVGRKANDFMGGGYTQPSNANVPDSGLLARGVTTAGDLDRDGRDDLLIGSVLADPEGKTDAGEVYVIYGLTP